MFRSTSKLPALSIGDRFCKVDEQHRMVWVVAYIYSEPTCQHAIVTRECVPHDSRTLSAIALQDKRLYIKLPAITEPPLAVAG